MSATREQLDQSLLDLAGRIAKVRADRTLKGAQARLEASKAVVSGFAAGGVLLGAGGAIGALLTRAFSH